PRKANSPFDERPSARAAAEQRDELAPFIKKTRSRGTIAKGGGLAKRPRSAKGLPFSCSRVGRRPVGNYKENKKPWDDCQRWGFGQKAEIGQGLTVFMLQGRPKAGGQCSGRDVRFIARPPHRTVRAAFPHTAPTSGV